MSDEFHPNCRIELEVRRDLPNGPQDLETLQAAVAIQGYSVAFNEVNHVLLSAGLPWVTIRSDERVSFFKAIEHAQVDGDAVPFIRFVWHLIQQSAMDLQRKRSRRNPARKTPRRRPA
jgi:hypothetical protein